MSGAESSFECGRCGAPVLIGTARCPSCETLLVSGEERTIGATIGRRALAWLVDSVLIGLILIVFFAILGNLFPESLDDQGGGGPVVALASVGALLLPALYFFPFDTRSGQSPGKRVANLRLAALDGREHLGLRAALLRGLWRYISLVPAGLGYLWVLGADRRAWHDMMSRSVVIPADVAVVVEDERRPESIRRPRTTSARPAVARIRPVVGLAGPAADDYRGEAAATETSAPLIETHPDAIEPDVALELANRLREAGHLEHAAWLLALVQRTRDDDPGGWCHVALLLADAGQPRDALNVVNSVLLAEPTFQLGLAVKTHALLSLESDASDREALQLTERFAAAERGEPIFATALARALVANSRADEAENVLDASGELGDESVRAASIRISVAEIRRDDAAALRWAAAAADMKPFDAGGTGSGGNGWVFRSVSSPAPGRPEDSPADSWPLAKPDRRGQDTARPCSKDPSSVRTRTAVRARL